MEYWKTTVTILLPLLANIFSYWGLLRSGGLNTRKYWLVEVRRPQYEKILASRGDWEWLYCDSSRGIRWNIAWALLSSQNSYSIWSCQRLLTFNSISPNISSPYLAILYCWGRLQGAYCRWWKYPHLQWFSKDSMMGYFEVTKAQSRIA